jgi:2-polyprenyl-3-methyl-5-hydroxy-6-metoxy-1,4-benzoquinol methylase
MKMLTSLHDFAALDSVHLFGAGEGGRILKSEIERIGITRIDGFIDSERSGLLDGLTIHKASEWIALGMSATPIVIASRSHEEIARILGAAGFHHVFNGYPVIMNLVNRQRAVDYGVRVAHAGEALRTPELPFDICPVCGGTTISTIEVLVSWWMECIHCGNSFRRPKSEIVVAPEIWETLMLDSGRLLNRMDKGATYDLFGTDEYFASRNHHAEFLELRRDVFDRFGLVIPGKRILDISGGPGGVAMELSRHGAACHITEISPTGVAFMRDKLNLPAIKFNYSCDDISAFYPGNFFDIVMIRFSLNFCTNTSRFAKALRTTVKTGASVYISYCLPSVGAYVRFQYDRNTYLAAHNPETTARSFGEAGFEVMHRSGMIDYHGKKDLDPPECYVFDHYFTAARHQGIRPDQLVRPYEFMLRAV